MYTNIMNYHICHTVMARASKQDLYSVSFPIKISAAGNAYLIKENLGYCKDFHCAEFFFTTRKRCHVTPSSYSYLLFFQLFWIIIQVLKIPKKLFTSEFTCGNLFNFFPKKDFLDFLEQILFGVFVVTNMLSYLIIGEVRGRGGYFHFSIFSRTLSIFYNPSKSTLFLLNANLPCLLCTNSTCSNIFRKYGIFFLKKTVIDKHLRKWRVHGASSNVTI